MGFWEWLVVGLYAVTAILVCVTQVKSEWRNCYTRRENLSEIWEGLLMGILWLPRVFVLAALRDKEGEPDDR